MMRDCSCLPDALVASDRSSLGSFLLRGPQFDYFKDFSEGHACPLVDGGDVRERLGTEDTDRPSPAGYQEALANAHDTAAVGLAGHIAGCLVGGCVLIPGQARQLPENKECRHA